MEVLYMPCLPFHKFLHWLYAEAEIGENRALISPQQTQSILSNLILTKVKVFRLSFHSQFSLFSSKLLTFPLSLSAPIHSKC